MRRNKNSPTARLREWTSLVLIALGGAGLLRANELSLTENAVHLGATRWADALCHAAARVGNLYSSLEVALLFALHAVAVICHCHNFLLIDTVWLCTGRTLPVFTREVGDIRRYEGGFCSLIAIEVGLG